VGFFTELGAQAARITTVQASNMYSLYVFISSSLLLSFIHKTMRVWSGQRTFGPTSRFLFGCPVTVTVSPGL
jgi:hypothetical protein